MPVFRWYENRFPALNPPTSSPGGGRGPRAMKLLLLSLSTKLQQQPVLVAAQRQRQDGEQHPTEVRWGAASHRGGTSIPAQAHTAISDPIPKPHLPQTCCCILAPRGASRPAEELDEQGATAQHHKGLKCSKSSTPMPPGLHSPLCANLCPPQVVPHGWSCSPSR